MRPTYHHASASEFEEKIIQVNRVSKKTKGGNQIGFSVLVVVGDRQGKVGVALGKGPDVMSSIKKGVRKAKKTYHRALAPGYHPVCLGHQVWCR